MTCKGVVFDEILDTFENDLIIQCVGIRLSPSFLADVALETLVEPVKKIKQMYLYTFYNTYKHNVMYTQSHT